MARALWKGAISFGLVNVPVDLYSADRGHSLDLTMLDRRDHSPIGYRRINKNTREEVPWGEIVKGYEYERGQYVILTDEDLKRANVRATQTVDILGFVDADRIPVLYYETPYYLAPGKRGEKGYALLLETLKRSRKVGIAQVVIRTTQRLAAVVPNERVLLLDILRYKDQVRDTKDLPLPQNAGAVGVRDKEIDMATQLVDNMSVEWDPESYKDTYREDVLALIEKRVKAGQLEGIETPARAPRAARAGQVVDLMSLLRQSVEERGRARKPPRRAGERHAKHGSRRRAS